jgi:geranylgeranyl transferase type-2 subunit beta
MAKLKPETTIPLRCSICPKNPQFSDVSHLLTHMSSKSHLANRFKLQIQSQSEITAKALLDNFDAWYKENNLDAMLADRMAAKDHKKVRKERKARVSVGPVSPYNTRAFISF